MKGLVPASERKAVVVGITQQNPGKNLYRYCTWSMHTTKPRGKKILSAQSDGWAYLSTTSSSSSSSSSGETTESICRSESRRGQKTGCDMLVLALSARVFSGAHGACTLWVSEPCLTWPCLAGWPLLPSPGRVTV